MKLSDITPTDLRELRVMAAIELAYPQQTRALGDKRASVILAKWNAWRDTTEPQVSPGMGQ